MSWVLAAILSHLFWAGSNIVDKYVIENRVKNPYVYIWLQWMFGIMALILLPFISVYLKSGVSYAWLFLSSLVSFVASFFYIKALKNEEVTRINLLWNLIPLFSLVIAWFTIGQQLATNQFVALFLLILGAVFAALHADWFKFKFSSALLYIIIACFLYATYAVIFSHVARSESFVSSFFWSNIFGFSLSFVLFSFRNLRRDFFNIFREKNTVLLSTTFGVSIFNFLGAFFNVWALSLGLVSLVYAMEGFQVIFVFIGVILISSFNRKLLQEKFDKKNLLLKLAALVLMVAGIVVLNVY